MSDSIWMINPKGRRVHVLVNRKQLLLAEGFTVAADQGEPASEPPLKVSPKAAAAKPAPAQTSTPAPASNPASEPPLKVSASELNAMSKPKLVGWAKENLGLDLDVAERKEELLAAIDEALTQRNSEG